MNPASFLLHLILTCLEAFTIHKLCLLNDHMFELCGHILKYRQPEVNTDACGQRPQSSILHKSQLPPEQKHSQFISFVHWSTICIDTFQKTDKIIYILFSAIFTYLGLYAFYAYSKALLESTSCGSLINIWWWCISYKHTFWT